MLEIARNFEQAAAGFSPVFLIGLGVAAVLSGLFVWLGGLGLRKLLITIVGAAAGAVCGFFIIGRSVIPAVLLAGLAAGLAVIFERVFITILAAVLAAALCFAALAWPYVENAAGFSAAIKQVCSQMPAYNWAIIAAAAVIFTAAGVFLWRLVSALCCAALGTLLISAGMISLLLYKGAAPVTCIIRRAPFYAMVFATMIIFGTIEQLLLCRRFIAKNPKKIKENNDGLSYDTCANS